jgi:hypothetical protein
VQHLLSTPAAEKAMKSAKVDLQQVKTAVSSLDDQELAQLAARANKAQADFSAARVRQEKLVQTEPDYGPAVCVLGLIDAGLGRKEEAQREGVRSHL